MKLLSTPTKTNRLYRVFITFSLLMISCIILIYFTHTNLKLTRFVSMINATRLLLVTQDNLSLEYLTLVSNLSTISNSFKLKNIDCSAIFNGSKNATNEALGKVKNIDNPISDEQYIDLSTNCTEFQNKRRYIMSSLTKEEDEFPIAYSMLIYTDIEMVERLLRAIYRPQNYYCIHVDEKSSSTFLAAISSVVKCFSNVFISSRRVEVKWGTFTVLEPELICMADLWKYPKWKYFINLTGQEFPLKTNFELVRILTAYNGASDVASTYNYANSDRWGDSMPPYGMKPVKGSAHIVVARNFVDYILHNDTAKDLLDWTKTTFVPDETFFPILNANPQLGIKGTYKGEPEHTAGRPFLARFKNWGKLPCAGHHIREICILSTGDLLLLGNSNKMFANKFFLNKDRVVISCLEEKIFNDTRDFFTGEKIFDSTYYANVDFVKNQVT